MSNAVYSSAKESLTEAQINVLTDTLMVQAYDEDAVFDDTDVFRADLVGTAVGLPVQITSVDNTAGRITGSLGAFNWPAGFTVSALVIYRDAGAAVTDRLIAWIDSKGDSSAISIPTTGGVVVLHWIDPFFSIGG